MSLESIVITIVSRIIKMPENQLNTGSGLGLVSGWDSLNHTTLIIELENEFDIAFDFDELDKIITVKAIIQSLAAKGVTA